MLRPGLAGALLLVLSGGLRLARAEDAQGVAANIQSGVDSAPASVLKILRGPELVRCAPVSLSPCLSVTMAPADTDGRPAAVILPAKQHLLQSVQIVADGETISPFYVSPEADEATERPNVVLIEVDVSGSMNEPVPSGSSRFNAAKKAIENYLGSMQDGVDEIAIVPFESHHVVPTIQAAVFTSKRAEAMAQLHALPDPGPNSNTALFQAVYSGVQALQAQAAGLVKMGTQASDFHPSLIVMTDGKNEVARGDDGNLLDGPLGLQQAAAKVASSSIDVVGIGFGDPRAIDQDALKRLSKRMFLAQNDDQLIKALHATTPLHAHTLAVTFLSPWSDRSSMASRDPQFSFSLSLPDGRRLTSAPVPFLAPAMGAPLYQRQASSAELEALLLARPQTNAGWSAVLRGMLVLLGCSVLLLLLWFWVPRLIWGGTYDPASYAGRASRRWRGESLRGQSLVAAPVPSAGMSMRLPEGFEGANVDKHQRSAEQLTQVHSIEPANARAMRGTSHKPSR